MKFETPKELPTGVDELKKLRADASEAFKDAYKPGEAPSEEHLEYLQSLVDFIEKVDSAVATHNEEEQRANQARDLQEKLDALSGEDKEETEDTDNAGEAEENHPETSNEDTPENTPEDNSSVEEETEKEEAKHQVASHNGKRERTAFSQAAKKTMPKDIPGPTVGWRLTTAAKNYERGIVDSRRVAEEFEALAHGRAARSLSSGGRSETTLAYLDREAPSEFAIGDEADALSVLDKVTDESRLPGGLVAAGGWCSPSETVYEFLPVEAPGDLLSLPEVTIRRGGVKFPKEPDFSTVYEQIGFHQTETQAQAKTEKPCYEIPCAEFEELRLDVQGICITAGILQQKGWPELTRKYIDEALRLHQHKINAWRIGKIVEGSTSVTGITGTFGTAGAVLSTLELQVADMRAKHRIPSSRAVEGIAPVWLLGILRADLAYRDEVLPQQVTDEQIKAHFRNLGANIQFVGDWQNTVIGGATAPKAWPTTVDVILYPSGTWYSALEPVINLGVTYDATLLKTNQAIQLFTEDGVAVGKRGPESRKITIPVAVNGEVGARHANAS